MNQVIQRIEQRVAALPQGLQAHINRVREIAVELAPRHNVEPERAALGMLAHDVARAMSDAQLMRHATELGLPIGVVDRQVPLLLHGPVGAEILQREDGLAETDLYQAVYWHTTAHPSLERLGKVVFLADKLDPQKRHRYPYQPQLHQLAMQDLDQAILEFLNQELVAQVRQGQLVPPAMLETRNHLLAAEPGGEVASRTAN
ncbi:MAG: bis(5'-nucleosyl)-tetraphosphatase (symmetrical) YqeK [Dehalococcoidia bacterium]